MTTAKNGELVTVHYTGKLKDGTVFDSSEECGCGCDEPSPLQFTIGGGELLPAFENTVVGMAVGETRTVTIPAAEAYGESQPELIAEVDRKQLPADLTSPQAGMELEVELPGGETLPVLITAVSETSVTIDGNHPLAGEDLTFDIRLVKIG